MSDEYWDQMLLARSYTHTFVASVYFCNLTHIHLLHTGLYRDRPFRNRCLDVSGSDRNFYMGIHSCWIAEDMSYTITSSEEATKEMRRRHATE